MGEPVEIGQGVGIGEDRRPPAPAGRCWPSGRDDRRTEVVDHRLVGGPARLQDLAGDGVGVDHAGAPRGQAGGHGRLAGADTAGEAHEQHGRQRSAARRPATGPIADATARLSYRSRRAITADHSDQELADRAIAASCGQRGSTDPGAH